MCSKIVVIAHRTLSIFIILWFLFQLLIIFNLFRYVKCSMLKRIILMIFFIRFLVFFLFPVHRIFIYLSMVLNACLCTEPVSLYPLYFLWSILYTFVTCVLLLLLLLCIALYIHISDNFLAQFEFNTQNTNAQRMENNNQTN